MRVPFRRRRSEGPAPSTDQPPDLQPARPVADPLARRLAVVEAELAAVAGDRSLCELSASGPTGHLKRWEGAMAALLELRRARRAQPESSLDALAEALARSWQAELDAAKGPVWAAYRRGGVDELEALRHELAGDVPVTARRPPGATP